MPSELPPSPLASNTVAGKGAGRWSPLLILAALGFGGLILAVRARLAGQAGSDVELGLVAVDRAARRQTASPSAGPGVEQSAERTLWRRTRGRLSTLWQRGQAAVAEQESDGWGWLPPLSLVSPGALLVLASADVAARQAEAWAELLFWLGLLGLYVPIALRLLLPAVSRREVGGLVVLLGLTLYLVKVLHSPLVFTFPDEFAHSRTANDIALQGRLFADNPIIPVSALYPGLEIIASALARLSGISLHSAGLLVIGVARLLHLLALYSVYERVGGSYRLAGIATVIYVANPNYLFFMSSFSYESLALPVATLLILALLHRQEMAGRARQAMTAAAVLLLGLVVATHHLTAYALSLLLLLWLLVAHRLPGGHGQRQGPGLFAAIAPVASLVWLLTVGSVVVDYLAPHFLSTLNELLGLILGQSGPGRQLFQSAGGSVAPLWERLAGISSAGLVVAGLPLGLFLLWRKHRRSALALVLALVALAYPPSLILRLTGFGWEIGNRASEFIFVGVALVLALTALALVGDKRSLARTAVAMLAVTVIFTGGVIAGWTPSWRLPAPQGKTAPLHYQDPEGIAAARWMRAYLGPERRVASQSIHMLLMGSYGEQWIMTTLSDGINPSWSILAPQLGPDQVEQLRRGQVEYVVIDRRQSSSDPRGSPYYPGIRTDFAFAKFDYLYGSDRIFDSGNVQIYDIRRLLVAGELGSAR
ncbi:MAG: hypothetical protein ACYC4L_03340 [Chloroflexota bacterium]